MSPALAPADLMIEAISENDRLSAEDWADPEGALDRERLRRRRHAVRRRAKKSTGGRHAC